MFSIVAAPMSPANAGSSVAVQPAAGAMDLVMDGTGSVTTHVVRIAVVMVAGDGPRGFTLGIGSGSLTKLGGRPVAFQVAVVDHDAAVPTASAFTTPSGMRHALSVGPGSYTKDLYIKYCSAALQDPGTYSASVDLDVFDN
jgi:hypothetical protein